jgi:hypothetical protein
LPCPKGPGGGAGNLEFTIYVPLFPKMLHIKFENNWNSVYQEVKDVKILTDTIYYICPALWGKTATPRIINFTILVEAFLLYNTIH